MKYILYGLALLMPFSSHAALQLINEKVVFEKIEDYEECQGRSYSGNICDTALRDWVGKHPDAAFKAGKLTRRRMNAWGAVYFFDVAFKNKAGDCKDEDVWLAIESAAKLPPTYNEPIEAMKRIAFGPCFDFLKENLRKAATAGTYGKANLCPGLKEKKVKTFICK